MSIITLTTDFGLKDHFAGALKGKILSDCPETTIIDISHNIDPFNIAEASYVINAAYSYFPKGTVHLIGVDYELNKENRHVALEWNDHFFVCADNGIPGLLTEKIVPQKIVAINIHDRLTKEATDLDVFVTVACHIARGGLLNVIGREIDSLKQLTELKPVVADDRNSIRGYVIYVDHFGNVVTNITRQLFNETVQGRNYEIVFNDQRLGQRGNNIKSIWPRYSDIGSAGKYPLKDYEGAKLAIFNEAGYLEIALYKGNNSSAGSASGLLGLGYRDPVNIIFNP